ncbi:MAG: DUF2461 domain-containing protein [Mariprofundaceae bacterium]|nr:DUF2461 domain-containing protein [Mariprofundaceae bacterium]
MGLTEDTFAFLRLLAENNNRDWFATHKEDYEIQVRSPAFSLIEHIAPQLAQISPHFVAKASKMGGSLMRVHRDVRFSKNKQPYKTHIGIQFRHEQGKDIHTPGFYVHIEANNVFLGVGIWHPDAVALKGIRQHIDTFSTTWTEALAGEAFRKHFSLTGDSLKRAPKGYPISHPMIEDLKRKDFIAIAPIAPELCFEADFADIVSDYFKLGVPLMQELCRAVRIPF